MLSPLQIRRGVFPLAFSRVKGSKHRSVPWFDHCWSSLFRPILQLSDILFGTHPVDTFSPLKITSGVVVVPPAHIHSIIDTHCRFPDCAWCWSPTVESTTTRAAWISLFENPLPSMLYEPSSRMSCSIIVAATVSNQWLRASLDISLLLAASISCPISVCSCGWRFRNLFAQFFPSGWQETSSIDKTL